MKDKSEMILNIQVCLIKQNRLADNKTGFQEAREKNIIDLFF